MSPRGRLASVPYALRAGQAESVVGGGVVPAGAVLFFNLPVCPAGWTELTAARGRYLLGLPGAGALGAAVGTALSDRENRAAGKHGHAITDPGHSHTVQDPHTIGLGAGPYPYGAASSLETGNSTTGITVNESDGASGTNAPYLQFLVCQKS